LNMIYRVHRLADVVCLMRLYRLEPKVIRFVHSNYKSEPKLFLIKAIKGASAQLTISRPLYIYDENGEYSNDINQIYCRKEV